MAYSFSAPASPHRAAFLGAFALSLAVVFLAVNYQAYGSYFTDDDLANMANGRAPISFFVRALIEPSLTGDRAVRASAYLYYYAMVRLAGMNFGPYIAGIHAIHLLNVVLVWMLARALGATTFRSCAAASFYGFHAAAFSLYWSAMYVFDLLSATFVLGGLLAYVRGKDLLCLLFFWLSLKSKEATILFPLVLVVYEATLGERRWKRAIVLLAVSAVVGTRAFLANAGRDDDYTFRFTPAALWTCVRYYAEKLVMVPYVGLAAFAIPVVDRSRRVVFGLAVFVLLLAPMLFLPGRLFGPYLYAPMAGLAILVSGLRSSTWIAVFLLAWLPWNYAHFRPQVRERIAVDGQRRVWLDEIGDLVRANPDIEGIVYDNKPQSLEHWGITGLVDLLHPVPKIPVQSMAVEGGAELLSSPNVALLTWDGDQRLFARRRGPDAAYIRFDNQTPLWQILEGFPSGTGSPRWMNAQARARLLRPRGARRFRVEMQAVFRGSDQSRIDLKMNGRQFGSVALTREGPVTFEVPVPAGPEENVEIGFTVVPPIPNGDDLPLGHLIAGFGFVE